MTKGRKKYTAEFKVQILREHLENQIPVGKLCEENKINPNSFYQWKKEIFQGALTTFSKAKSPVQQNDKITHLEEKLKYKDSIINIIEYYS